MTDNATSGQNVQIRDEDVLNFYAAENTFPIALSVLDGSKYADVIKDIGLPNVNTSTGDLKNIYINF